MLQNDAPAVIEDITELEWEDMVLDAIDEPEHTVDSTGGCGLTLHSCTGCDLSDD
jgi:hypothetical protein